MQIFDLTDFTKKRSPNDFYDWTLKQFENIKTPIEKEFFLKRKGLTKVLVEEIYPLAIFSKENYENEKFLIQPVIGSQSFDANVYSSENSLIEKIEVTQAIDGYIDHLQRELLIKGKPAPFTSKFAEKKDGSNEKILIMEGGSIFPLINQISLLAFEAIKKKLAKEYDDGTILLVVLKSLPIIRTEIIEDKLKEIIAKTIQNNDCKFSKIFLIDSGSEAEKKSFCVWKKH